VKIGCADRSGGRLDAHRRFGWKVAWVVETPTGDDAYNLEQTVLGWWRNELHLPFGYPAERLPQEGYTETAAMGRYASCIRTREGQANRGPT
jgi:hypothetical protein